MSTNMHVSLCARLVLVVPRWVGLLLCLQWPVAARVVVGGKIDVHIGDGGAQWW